MGLFSFIKDFVVYMLTPQSDEDLASEREELRVSWLKDGDARKRYRMDQIDKEMTKRANKKFAEEHPDAKPRHREHGWYLPNDD